ncbi:hypothetical protein DSO57_1000336 [Entomophthora muscae]|uniref:Uncharacterized protein n=2 Tax=Entomophthora muscae TaxID=34485 RepID=A0ACC2TK75_9FUNG|nr:hypothetical protein DSO57_1037232 [Entomophthora muscae]KAJ9075053.1 hypothetical protein DSO57_1000336 [Entomophthora muscae]
MYIHLPVTSFVLFQLLISSAFSSMASPLSLNLKGTFQEKAPDSKRVVWKYFKNLTFTDGSYTLLDTFYCPPGVAPPKTFMPIRPTTGQFTISAESLQELEGSSAQLTLNPVANVQGQASFSKPSRVFSIQVENQQQPTEIRLTEAGQNGKVHIMLKTA